MNAEDLRSVMDEGYEKFCEYVERYEREKRRTQYGLSLIHIYGSLLLGNCEPDLQDPERTEK